MHFWGLIHIIKIITFEPKAGQVFFILRIYQCRALTMVVSAVSELQHNEEYLTLS